MIMAAALVYAAFGTIASTAAERCPVLKRPLHEGLEQNYSKGDFIIRYSLEGSHALVDKADRNGTGVPDNIEDLAIQLIAADQYYREGLGLRSPLQQARYRDAEKITVLVKMMPKAHGLAFDEPHRLDGAADCGLTIIVHAGLQFDHNVTPAHELFHLYQYGYAMFKTRWYLEGMARWVEGAFKKGRLQMAQKGLKPACEAVTGESYKAARFWQAGASAYAADEGKAVYAPVSNNHYGNGARIVQPKAYQGSYIRSVLEALTMLSAEISAGHEMEIYLWPEIVQHSHQFDAAICKAIEKLH